MHLLIGVVSMGGEFVETTFIPEAIGGSNEFGKDMFSENR